MKHSLSDRLLLFAGAYLDWRRRWFSLSSVGALPDDPRFRVHRQWAEQYLRNRRKRRQLAQALQNLRRRGYLEAKVLGRSRGYVLSPKGEQKLSHLQLHQSAGNRPKLPPGLRLMVFFDVPEQQRKDRNALRVGLRELGFEQLQKSVWLTVMDVRRELKALIRELNLVPYALSLLVQEVADTENVESVKFDDRQK